MLQTAIFIITFSLRIAKGINSSLLVFLSDKKKEKLEIVIPHKNVPEMYVKSVDMMDHLKEQKEKVKTQQIMIPGLYTEKSKLFLN